MEQKSSLTLTGVNRILVRGVNWVGDTVLTYPAVQNLKRLFPRSHLAILVPDYLTDLWKTFPSVDEIISFEKRGDIQSFREDVKLALTLRKRQFDLAVIFPRSFRSALLPYLARIPVRIGYRDEGRALFLTHGISRSEEVLRSHRVYYYQKLIEPLGRVNGSLSPKVYLREEDRIEAEDRLRDLRLLDGRPVLGMNPGATYGLAKCWAPSRFGELGKRLSEKWKASILLFGKDAEAGMAEEILRFMGGGGVDLVGKTSLLQLAALLERCQLLVTNDTGTMHVAAAVGTPVVAIFGSTDARTTGPWGADHVVVKKEVSCSPCLKRICPTDHRCMEEITVDEVEQVIDGQLRKTRS